jgi:hypothetical protein
VRWAVAAVRDGPSVRSPRLWTRHLGAGAWFLVIALLVLAAALAHGTQFGSFDLLHQFGLLRQPGLVPHNAQAGDQSDSLAPWATLSWIEVHRRQLPLWNPYSALGMPLAFNWQSASFSLPSLVGYLAPLNWAFTVQVVVTLVISGSGVYALGRAFGWGTVACVFAGTVFELSGPMVGWLGTQQASVMSWAGWLFAAAVLILKGGTSARRVTGLALVVAAMVYAGHPEGLTLFAAALVLFVVVYLARSYVTSPARTVPWNPLAGVVVGSVAGVALGSPLLLPGLQVISRSVHNSAGVNPAELVKGNPPLPAGTLVHLLFQGYDGLPVAGSHWFGYAGGYSETAAYLGVIPLVLAVLALATRGRRPEVMALAGVAAVMALMAFLPPLVDALGSLPLVGNLVWQKALLPAVFTLTVLAGVGMDALVREPRRAAVRRWLGGALVGVVVLVAGLWLFGRGTLPAAEASIRRSSFLWAAVEVAIGVAVVGALFWAARATRPPDRKRRASVSALGRWAGIALLVCETAFLVTAGAPLWTASSTPYGSTPSTVALRQAVGSSVVGFGAPLCFFPPGLGITPNAQVAYGIRELGAYDPLLPNVYYTAWKALTGEAAGSRSLATYCPAIRTAGQARLYGVSFVLEPAGSPGPQGTQRNATIGGEGLYKVPGAAAATLTPRPASGASPDASAPSTTVAVDHPDPAAWTMVTTSPHPGVLRLRLTDLPGWHATVDGRPVPVIGYAGVMLQVDVPAGRHRVELHYWPAAFTQGLVLAGLAVVGLLTACTLEVTRRRRRSRTEPSEPARSERGRSGRPDPTPATAGDP